MDGAEPERSQNSFGSGAISEQDFGSGAISEQDFGSGAKSEPNNLAPEPGAEPGAKIFGGAEPEPGATVFGRSGAETDIIGAEP